MQVTSLLALLAVLGPLASWLLTDLSAGWEKDKAVSAAVADTRKSEQSACTQRLTAIQTELNNKAADALRRAEEAERNLAPTPAEAAELQDLCNRSASCRSRKRETAK